MSQVGALELIIVLAIVMVICGAGNFLRSVERWVGLCVNSAQDEREKKKP